MMTPKVREARESLRIIISELRRKDQLIGRAREMVKSLGHKYEGEPGGHRCRFCGYSWRATGSLHSPSCELGKLLHDTRTVAR